MAKTASLCPSRPVSRVIHHWQSFSPSQWPTLAHPRRWRGMTLDYRTVLSLFLPPTFLSICLLSLRLRFTPALFPTLHRASPSYFVRSPRWLAWGFKADYGGGSEEEDYKNS